MGLWSFYFLAKLYLYYKGFIHWDILLNLFFALFIIMPMPKIFKPYRAPAFFRSFLSIVLGLLLLWHDSWLPPPLGAVMFLKQQGIPSKEYIYSFLFGYYNQQVVMVGALILFAVFILNKFITLTPFIIILLIVVPLKGFGQSHGKEIEDYLNDFYDSESARVIRFKKPKTGAPDFDIVILHVCSLSWDDLKGSGMENTPFFKQFNYLFTNFNTATAYSGPAVIRLLQANCGQSRHDNIYTNGRNECYLLDALDKQGFETYLALNHDGVYGDFAKEVKRYGHLNKAPISPTNIPVQQHMFDDSLVYDDYLILERWWAIRQRATSRAAALYYNTVTLHDGVHWEGEANWWKRDRKEQYKERITKLFADITKFFHLLAASKRNIVVVFVPEHGMALHPSVLQAQGLRDIPLPKITLVPVGIKFIGEKYKDIYVKPQIISKPTSYLSISSQLAAFAEQSPFKSEGYNSRRYLDSIPITDYVAENQGGIQIVKMGDDYYFYGKEKKWIRLSAAQLD